jgi:hypothetical protein
MREHLNRVPLVRLSARLKGAFGDNLSTASVGAGVNP